MRITCSQEVASCYLPSTCFVNRPQPTDTDHLHSCGYIKNTKFYVLPTERAHVLGMILIRSSDDLRIVSEAECLLRGTSRIFEYNSD